MPTSERLTATHWTLRTGQYCYKQCFGGTGSHTLTLAGFAIQTSSCRISELSSYLPAHTGDVSTCPSFSRTTLPNPGANIKNANSDLPPELQAFASLLDAQPSEVQRAFQFLLATAMHEAGKFELLNVADVDGRWHYTFSGAGEVFSVVRPEMDKQTERQVREMVRDILAEEGSLGRDVYLSHRRKA